MNPNNRPTSTQLLTDIIQQATSLGCGVEIETVMYKAGAWLLVRIVDKHPGLNKGIFLLTAGIHGREIAGPLTIQQRFAGIIASTRVAGLQLVCYPLMNPSGYDNSTDRNIDGDGGNAGNNDYLRYQFDGGWTWKFSSVYPCRGWRWSSDPIVSQRLPAETLVMHKFLQEEAWPNIQVALDLHQDYLTPNLPAGSYQYTFGDLSRYNAIIEKVRKLVPVLSGVGFCFNRDKPDDIILSDENGNVVFHDGSLSDLAYHIDVPHSLTIETTGATELQTAIEINMIWIRGLCELISRSPTGETTMSQQTPKPPDPFDLPSEQARMVNEGGHEPKLPQTSTTPDSVHTDDYGDVATSVSEALESFRHLNKGGAAPHVVVEIDGEHMSARWEKPKK